jgi:hypothetical protein
MKRRLLLTSWVLLIGLIRAEAAQSTAAPSAAVTADTLQSSMANFAAGNGAKGEQQITSLVTARAGRKQHVDLDVGCRLATVAFGLKDMGNDAAAAQAAVQAIAHLTGGAAAAMLAQDKATAAEVAGLLSERVLQDFSTAKVSYEKALTLDPSRATAKAGIARLTMRAATFAKRGK